MLWDDKNNVFYRFTYFNLPKVADEKTKIRSFVSVLSQDLELLGEREITDFGFTTPNPQYAKDGKVYLFLNLDDELAFVRLMIN
mgnify:CR=1 FL=1